MAGTFHEVAAAELGVTAAAALAGLVRGFSGFGAAMVFVPIAGALYSPEQAVVLLFLTDTVVDSVVEADGKVGGLNIRNVVTGEESVLDATALFVAIGHDPRSGFLEGQVAVDEGGYVTVEDPSTRTSVDGVFACGDLVDKTYRQAITAAGSGCRAALDAQHYLAAL